MKMSVSGNDPLQEFNSKNAKRILGYTFLGGILAVPAILLLFLFVSLIFYVFINFNLSTYTALNTIFVYSCLVVPIAIVIISVILLKRKQENFKKVMQLSWAGLIGAGALLVVFSSAIGGGEWLIRTPTPTLTPSVTATFTLTVPPSLTPTITLTPTVTTTPTPVPIVCSDIEKARSDKTDLQWQDYQRELIGQRIQFAGEVLEVRSGGEIQISDSYCDGFFTYVVIYNVPLDFARTVNKDQFVQGFGTVKETYELLGLHIYINVIQIE